MQLPLIVVCVRLCPALAAAPDSFATPRGQAHDKAEDGLMAREGLEVTGGGTEDTAMVCHRLRLLEVIKVPSNLSF